MLITAQLKQFKNIKYVNVSSNDIEEFPGVLLEMSLNRLTIVSNQLQELPDGLSSILFSMEGAPLTKAQVLKTQEVIEIEESDITVRRSNPG